MTPYIDIDVTVLWNRRANPEAPVPSQINVTLLGINVDSLDTTIASAGAGWKVVFKDMPEYGREKNPIANARAKAAGQMVLIDYAIEPAVLSGYTSVVTGNTAEGFVVTYTAIPPIPATGDNNDPALLLAALLASVTALVFLFRRKRSV